MKLSLTDEERNALVLECANAKSRCKEVWDVLQTLKKTTKTYQDIHTLWKNRYEKANRKLAEDNISIIKGERKEKTKLGQLKEARDAISRMSKDQLLAMINELDK